MASYLFHRAATTVEPEKISFVSDKVRLGASDSFSGSGHVWGILKSGMLFQVVASVPLGSMPTISSATRLTPSADIVRLLVFVSEKWMQYGISAWSVRLSFGVESVMGSFSMALTVSPRWYTGPVGSVCARTEARAPSLRVCPEGVSSLLDRKLVATA